MKISSKKKIENLGEKWSKKRSFSPFFSYRPIGQPNTGTEYSAVFCRIFDRIFGIGRTLICTAWKNEKFTALSPINHIKISWNQLFSNSFCKNVASTKFLSKCVRVNFCYVSTYFHTVIWRQNWKITGLCSWDEISTSALQSDSSMYL